MARNNYRIFSIGYKAIYGSNGLTFDEIKKELGRFDLNSMFELSAKIGMILFNTAGDISQLQNGQLNMIRSLYTDETERTDFAKRLNQALRRQQIPQNSWGIYSKQSILLFQKLALENCRQEGGEMMSPEVSSDISKILLSISDYINEHDFEPPKIELPKRILAERLRAYMFRCLSFSNNEKYPNPLYRQRKIINFLRAQQKGFTFAKYFKDATGVSLKAYFEAGATLSAKWGLPKLDFNIDEAWFVRREYFTNTQFRKSEVSKLYNLLTMDTGSYSDQYADTLKVLGGNDIYNYNFLTFMRKPLVPILENVITCPSPEYLVAKVTEGAYRIVSDYLNESNMKKQYDNLPNYWGKAYESYAHIRLRGAFGKNYRRVPEEQHKRADGMFEGKQSVILFEYKSIHIPYKGLITGDAQDLAKPYDHCFGKSQGVAQMVTHAEDIYDGSFSLKQPLGSRKILPVLVISSFLPSEPLHYNFFEKFLLGNGVKFNKYYMLPFIYLTIEEAEYLEALAAIMTPDELEKILIEFSNKIHTLDKENDFSFKNFLFSKGIQIPINKQIMDDYTAYTDKLIKHHFPKEYRQSKGTV
jgi:hypothetical protein